MKQMFMPTFIGFGTFSFSSRAAVKGGKSGWSDIKEKSPSFKE